MKRENRRNERAGEWKEFFSAIPKLHLPWHWIALAFLLNQTYSELLLRFPVTTARLMSGELEGSALMEYVLYYVLYAAVIIAQMMMSYFACASAVRAARGQVWKHMLHVSMEYYDSHNPSDMMSAITNDLFTGVRSFVQTVISLIPNFYYVLRAMTTIGNYHVLLIAAVLLPLPIKLLYYHFYGQWSFRTQRGLFQQIGTLTAYLAERIRNLALIKTYTNEKEELVKGEGAAKGLFDANMRINKLTSTNEGISALLSLLEQFIVLLFGVILLQQKKITMEQWVAFFLFQSTLTGKINMLLGSWVSVKSMQGSLARTASVMAAPCEKHTSAQAQTEKRGDDIFFEQVSFSYGEKEALQNISFTIPAGKVTAIAGLCGSGKTTLMNLIERFYEPKAGCIRMGNVPIQEYSLAEHRNRFSYVQQGTDIFSGTVREALCYGQKRSITDDEMWQAAELSGFGAYLKDSPLGLDIPVSAGGGSMSGGQRQRLVLAREFLRGAEVVLMDEPTSALDGETAYATWQTARKLFDGKTVVVITHDLSLLAQADQVVVLDNGHLEGVGTYAELLNACPSFQSMVHEEEASL